MALEKDQAKRLDNERKKQLAGDRTSNGKDRRNIYLCNEGLGVGSLLE
jgi:hypothetical protein